MNKLSVQPEDTAARTGTVVVISGPSGCGKTTVCNRLATEDPRIALSVSATTRPPRPGERDGVEYRFLSESDFRARVARGEFAEYAEYNGRLYGTPRRPLEEKLAEGRTVLVEIDVQGARQLRQVYPKALYIFLDTPNSDVARKRLEHRNTETPEERRRRLETAERERIMAEQVRFDYRVINDDLDETVAKVRNLIAGKTGKRTV
jgi:guanylate kinase